MHLTPLSESRTGIGIEKPNGTYGPSGRKLGRGKGNVDVEFSCSSTFKILEGRLDSPRNVADANCEHFAYANTIHFGKCGSLSADGLASLHPHQGGNADIAVPGLTVVNNVVDDGDPGGPTYVRNTTHDVDDFEKVLKSLLDDDEDPTNVSSDTDGFEAILQSLSEDQFGPQDTGRGGSDIDLECLIDRPKSPTTVADTDVVGNEEAMQVQNDDCIGKLDELGENQDSRPPEEPVDGFQAKKSSSKMDQLEERILPDRSSGSGKLEQPKPPDPNSNDEVADEDPANGDEAKRVDNDGHVHSSIQTVTVEENEKLPLAALVPEEDKPPDNSCDEDSELKDKEKEVEIPTYISTYDSFYLDVNNLGEDGLASYFKHVQIEELIEHGFTMESSKGNGKKNGKFQNVECVGKHLNQKNGKPLEWVSDSNGVWDTGKRKVSSLVAGD